MRFTLRKYNDHAFCTMGEGNFDIDLGVLDRKEASILLEEFKEAIGELEWFLQTTKE